MRCFWTGFIAVWAIIPMSGARQSVDALLWAVIAAPRNIPVFLFSVNLWAKKNRYLCPVVFFYLYLCINVINTDKSLLSHI